MRISILHKDVYEYLVESGISCEYMEKEKQIKIFIQIEGKQYELRMKFPQYYPYEFPEIISRIKKNFVYHIYIQTINCAYMIQTKYCQIRNDIEKKPWRVSDVQKIYW